MFAGSPLLGNVGVILSYPLILEISSIKSHSLVTSSALNDGTLTLVVYKDEKVVHTFSDKIVDNKSTVSFKPAAGDYRLAATVKTLDGKSFSKEINYQVLEDPFAME